MVPALLDAPAVAAARDHLATLPATGALVTAPLDTDPFFADLVARPALVGVATEVLGGAVEAFGCTYVVKAAGTGVATRWHQDGHPWAARGIDQAVSIGIALDDAGPANGGLLVIPGSHRLAAQPLRPATEEPNTFGVEIDPALVDESLAVPVVLAPGDASVHHPNLIHGAGANRSDRPRTTLVVRYRRG